MRVKITFFLALFSILCTFPQKKKATKKSAQDSILNTYYLYNKTDNEQLIGDLLNFIKMNEPEIQQDSVQSKVLYLKGVSTLLMNRFDKAQELLLNSLELAKKTDDALLKARIYNDLGVVIARTSCNRVESDSLYKKAIVEYKRVNEIPLQIDSYYNLAVNSRRMKLWQRSIDYAFEYLDLVTQDKERTRGVKRMYYYIGYNYLKLNQLDNAKHYLRLADITSDGYNSDFTLSLINEAYAELYEKEKNYKAAFERNKQVIKNLRVLNEGNEKKIQDFYVQELGLENKLKAEKDKIISSQRNQIFWTVIALALMLTLTIFLVHLRKKNAEKQARIAQLNDRLQSLVDNLKLKNDTLSEKKQEIESLLELNEQTLFSRVLKISTYNDTIRKINKDVEEYSEKNASASPYLLTISKKLMNLVSEEELWDDFKIQFEKTRPGFFQKLKGAAPNLSVNDLKHCTYIISNLKSKEVAQLINVSPRSVETTRYRIKKKMGLEKEENLYDYLSTL